MNSRTNKQNIEYMYYVMYHLNSSFVDLKYLLKKQKLNEQ